MNINIFFHTAKGELDISACDLSCVCASDAAVPARISLSHRGSEWQNSKPHLCNLRSRRSLCWLETRNVMDEGGWYGPESEPDPTN